MKKIIYHGVLFVAITCVFGTGNIKGQNNARDVIQLYMDAYEENDFNKRRELINVFWTESSVFKDHLVQVTGPDEFNSMIQSFRGQIPGLRVESKNHSTTSVYHSWEWQIFNGSGQLILSGYDFAELDHANKILRVHAFFH